MIRESSFLAETPSKGAPMKLTLSSKNVEWREPVERAAKVRSEKLNRLLKHFQPDLVQLHGCIEKLPRKAEYEFSLSLSLPTKTLHATGAAPIIRSAVSLAFAEIESQLKKHMELLRGDHEWKRKRPRAAVA
jgi:ribosome-associated translation inhibitor RaiA